LSVVSRVVELNDVDTPSKAITTEVPCSADGGETVNAWGGGVTSNGVEFADATPLTAAEMVEGAESIADATEGESPEGTVTVRATPELEADAAVAVALRVWPAWAKVTMLLLMAVVFAPKTVTESVEPTGPLAGDTPTTTGIMVRAAEVVEVPPLGAGLVTVTV
jgi:hypothetical protein